MSYLLYALTLFLSSALLFFVQPMIAKMLLPVLGGSPAVWNTCQVFFQGMLLAGYSYAHLSTRWLDSRRQPLLHLGVMALAALALPITIRTPADTSVLEEPVGWLLVTLLLAVGLPFFVLSTSAPMLQKWFSSTRHPDAADPYHLYAASNVGSVLALVAYPFVIEPALGLTLQTHVWAGLYGLLVVCVGLCAFVVWREAGHTSGAHDSSDASVTSPAARLAPLAWTRRGQWVLWAFIPSSMMLGVTTFITTDVAPIPLLWILPLALYLITFIIVFARRKLIATEWVMRAFPFVLVPLGVMFILDIRHPLWAITAFHFGALFVFALLFHGLMADDRPEAGHLTEFYIWLSVGGVLGGAFNALVAPVVFDSLYEYPLVIFLAVVALPNRVLTDRITRVSMSLAVVGAGIWTWRYVWKLQEWSGGQQTLIVIGLLIPMIGVPILLARQVWLARPMLAALVLVALGAASMPQSYELYTGRSFYATHVVVADSGYHMLYHGNTTHGVQSRDAEFRSVPLSYYYLTGPLGQVFEMLSEREHRGPVASVGLGTGATAAYTRPGQTMTFYEIDPGIIRIARDPALFTYLDDCPGTCEVVLGDGRLQLAGADARYELIVLDAYSSSSIPMHLLTREAVEIYLSRLAPDGVLAFHISNRHLDLEPMLTRMADELGLVTLHQDFWIRERHLYDLHVDDSEWVLMARNDEALGSLADDSRWLRLAPDEAIDVWTDDYANVLQAYRDPLVPSPLEWFRNWRARRAEAEAEAEVEIDFSEE